MHSYYSRQAIMPHFTGHSRQRGSGFGSLALGVGRVALPFAKKVLPAVQPIGKELFVQNLPEIMEVPAKIKSFKRAAKAALRKTVKQQIGGGGRRENRNFRRKRKLQRSWSVFSLKSKM